MSDSLSKMAESVRPLQGREMVQPETVGFTHGYSHWTPSGSRSFLGYAALSTSRAVSGRPLFRIRRISLSDIQVSHWMTREALRAVEADMK